MEILSIAECLVITEIKSFDHTKLLAKWEVDKCLLQASGLKFIWIQNEVSYVIGKNTPIIKKHPFEDFSIEHILIIF